LGDILGDFFTNASGHPAARSQLSRGNLENNKNRSSGSPKLSYFQKSGLTGFGFLWRQIDDVLFRNIVLVDDGVLVGGARVLERRVRLQMVVIVRVAVAVDVA
jgi:hypothetical protein